MRISDSTVPSNVSFSYTPVSVMKSTTRLPNTLLWIIGWMMFVGALWLMLAALAPSPALRGFYGGFCALYFLTAVGLYRMTQWGRILGGILLLIGALLFVLQITKGGFTSGKLLRLALNLSWGIYLLLPTTKRLFAASSGGRADRWGCLLQASYPGVIVALVAVGLVFKLPAWAVLIAAIALVAPLVIFEERLAVRFAGALGTRPSDLNRETWKIFRLARDAWLARDPARAEALLEDLGGTLSVRLLRGLIRMDRAVAGGGLDRVLYDAAFVASPDQADRIRGECEREDLDRRIDARTALIDDLLEDESRPGTLFATEVDARLQRITGRMFLSNAVFQHREAWAKSRPLCTGERRRDWLTVRLWDAQCPGAGVAAAAAARDPGVRDLAAIIARLELGEKERYSEAWMMLNSPNLSLMPGAADSARLLHLDSPYVGFLGPEAVAARMTARIEHIALLRRLREEYPGEAYIEIPWLLALLSGATEPELRKKKKFERWWADRRAAQLEFDGAFVSGLEAARQEDWARAEAAFAEAAASWPERTCAVYNRGLALLHLDRPRDAEEVFAKLAAAEPDEAVFWMRVGDARRQAGRAKEALQAYREAARLGGLEEEISFRLGVTLASQGREEEAARALDAAAGPDAVPEKLEELAAFLESQGIYKLAARYREEAFLKRMGEKPADKEEETDGDEEDLEPSA